MSVKLFYACLLPIICVVLTLFAGWVREMGLELPIAIVASLGAIPFFGAWDNELLPSLKDESFLL